MLTVRTYTVGEDVVLAVEDEGKGIKLKQEVLDKLGTPFVSTKGHGNRAGSISPKSHKKNLSE